MQPISDTPQSDSAQAPEKIPCQKETAAAGLLPIPQMIQLSQAAFRRDLPALMKTHYGYWVAYHGEQRLGFARSKSKLVQECLRRGLKDDEFVVRGVAPEMPDDDDRVV
jgi:hypothetical protein